MLSQEAILIQNKIIGVLLRMARLRAGKSVEECAQVLECDPALIVRAEEGEAPLSLPQIEALAHFFRVPLLALLGEEELPDDGRSPYVDMMAERRRAIGEALQKARLATRRTLEEVAAVLGCEPERIARVEAGEEDMPVVELKALADSLGLSLDELIGSAATTEGEGGQLPEHLPPEIRDFISRPINLPYLEIAMNLSQLPSESLRRLAADLLEITY